MPAVTTRARPARSATTDHRPAHLAGGAMYAWRLALCVTGLASPAEMALIVVALVMAGAA